MPRTDFLLVDTQMPITPSREISVPDLARRLGCTIPHAQRLIRTGRIRGRKTACGWVTTIEAAQAYLTEISASGDRPRFLKPE